MGLLYAVLALLAVGLLAIYSASYVASGAGKVLRQGIWVVIGLAGMGIMSRIDFRPWSRYWRLLTTLSVIMLIVTLLVAHPINGARAWIDFRIFRVEPAEFVTLAMIVALAGLFARYGTRIQLPRYFLHSLLIVAPPCLLILLQPDLGMVIIICAIWLVMVLVAGARWWMVLLICLSAGLLFTAAWSIPLPNGKTFIKDYQKARLDFLHADPSGNGYHQRQSRIAIGAGGLWGYGYRHGPQAHSRFLPEQDTDFIFAVIGEEFGLLGCLLVLGLYLFMLFRMIRIIEEAESPFGQGIAAGAATLFAVHVLVNIGMCLSLSPVTGIPLPFISYGGSSVLVNLLVIGLVLNISRHRQSRRTWVVNEDLVRA